MINTPQCDLPIPDVYMDDIVRLQKREEEKQAAAKAASHNHNRWITNIWHFKSLSKYIFAKKLYDIHTISISNYYRRKCHSFDQKIVPTIYYFMLIFSSHTSSALSPSTRTIAPALATMKKRGYSARLAI